MRWRLVAGDPATVEGDFDLDRIVVIVTPGDELGASYLSDVATWFAKNDIRTGYGFRLSGSCFKGPYGLQWDQVEIVLESDFAPGPLLDHLRGTWGVEGVELGDVGDPRLDRIT